MNYHTFKVSVRVAHKVIHAAYVAEDGVVDWATTNPLSQEVRDAMADMVADLE